MSVNDSTEGLSFEGVLDYPVLKLFIRHGTAFAMTAAIGCLLLGIWGWQITGSVFALVAGAAIGLFAGLLVRILVDMARVISDVLLPR